MLMVLLFATAVVGAISITLLLLSADMVPGGLR